MTKDEIAESRRICAEFVNHEGEYNEYVRPQFTHYHDFWDFVEHARTALPAALDEIEKRAKELEVWQWGGTEYQKIIRELKLALKEAEEERGKLKNAIHAAMKAHYKQTAGSLYGEPLDILKAVL